MHSNPLSPSTSADSNSIATWPDNREHERAERCLFVKRQGVYACACTGAGRKVKVEVGGGLRLGVPHGAHGHGVVQAILGTDLDVTCAAQRVFACTRTVTDTHGVSSYGGFEDT